jgi:hypothetical protein
MMIWFFESDFLGGLVPIEEVSTVEGVTVLDVDGVLVVVEVEPV